MKNKLKHLSKFCCKPKNELEFEAVRMAAKLEGVEWYEENCYPDKSYPQLAYYNDILVGYDSESYIDSLTEIPVLDFIKKLRMTEEEARKLEDDRVESDVGYNWDLIDRCKTFKALEGHKWRLSDDCKEVYLVKE